MKPGDLVGFGSRIGIIVEDHTMIYSFTDDDTDDEPYLMGTMMVLSEGQIERVTYANLEVISESR